MIELRSDKLVFSFPKVFDGAEMSIQFQRTMRIPDDGKDYPLPPGFGGFPLRHVDDCADRVPAKWLERGGVMLPMYQSEAMWLSFSSRRIHRRESSYPFAVKIAAGKIDAVTGKDWSNNLHEHPQDYIVLPEQPWLDGYCIEKGFIRQFVAMPLGSGYSAEEQITGKGGDGGLQIIVYPMKKEIFERRFPLLPPDDGDKYYVRSAMLGDDALYCCESAPDMGLAPGGRMMQEIYEDPFDFDDWDSQNSSRCFVNICNSLSWCSITGAESPQAPYTAEEYTREGLPWFDYYSDSVGLEGSKILNKLDSVAQLAAKKGDNPLPENQSVTPQGVVHLRRGFKPGQVREWVQ